MPKEIEAFKTLTRTWLLGITGMSAALGDRVYCGRPMGVPVFPLISFGLSRKPLTEFSLCAWDGRLNIAIYASTDAELNTIEDLILDYLARNAVEGALTDASVKCVQCALADVGEAETDVSMEDDSYQLLMRPLAFTFQIVSLET